MPTFSVRIPADLADRFDAAAAASGGRSARLRQLISEAAAPGPAAIPKAKPRRDAARVMVRLEARDAAGLDAEAAAMGLPRAAWVAALVRRRVRGAPTFHPRDETLLIAAQTEIRRIRVNVNQIARAVERAESKGEAMDLELADLEDLGTELRAHLSALRAAFAGNLAYWDAPTSETTS